MAHIYRTLTVTEIETMAMIEAVAEAVTDTVKLAVTGVVTVTGIER